MGIDVDTAVRINNGVREGVYAALSFIPGVGGILGAITNTLWPNGPDISTWEQVRADVEKLAGTLVDRSVANQLRLELAGFQEQYEVFEKTTDVDERKDEFVTLRGDVIRESVRYCDDTAPWTTLPYFVGMCTFRLTIDKYHIDHWHELYPNKVYNDQAKDEQDLIKVVDKYIAAAKAIRAKCIEYRKSKVEKSWTNGMGYVTDAEVPQTDWNFASRDDQARARVEARRHQNIEAEYGSTLDAILSPSQMWLYFKPGMTSQLRSMAGYGKPTSESPTQNYFKGNMVNDVSGPYPNFPRTDIPRQHVVSFDDGPVVERNCIIWNETIRSITWWTEEVQQVAGWQKIGERVTGIQVVYGRNIPDGEDKVWDTGIRGKKSVGRGCKEYSISRSTAYHNYISEVQIVCGDDANKAPIEALAFSWTEAKVGEPKRVIQNVGQYDFINSLPVNRFGRETLIPRSSATEVDNIYRFWDPPRMAYISGSHIPGIKLVDLNFHWHINQWS